MPALALASCEISTLFLFLACQVACGIFVPQPGTEPGPLAVRVQSPNHWTSREFLAHVSENEPQLLMFNQEPGSMILEVLPNSDIL